jgi:hypothetical protein
MTRLLGILGLGCAFLLVSPELRGTAVGVVVALARLLEENSPLSYVGVGVAMLVAAMLWVHRAAHPR